MSKPALIPPFTPPNVAQHGFDWPDELAEVEAAIDCGLQKVRCPKCARLATPFEVSLWLDPDARRVRFLCSGCRSTINRGSDTPAKDQALMCLQAHGVDVPEKLIQWMRVHRKIAAHPGSRVVQQAVGIVDGAPAVVEVAGGWSGVRSGPGVVD